jgi:hypothetical protein
VFSINKKWKCTGAWRRDVGVAGEYTAAVLDFHKNDMIKYVSSEKIDNIKKVLWLENEIFDIDIKMMQLVEQREILKSKPNEGDENTKRKIESDLESLEKKVNKKNEEIRKRWDEKNMMSALRDWLRYFGVAYDIKTSNHGEAGYKLQVKIVKKDKFLDLSSVGTGVSQVLPVLVMCLLADKGSTLVFEQPELHLHPRVQSRLADFFIAMAYSGKQCIVETHSEYFIDKLRLRVCESSLKNKKCPNLFKDLTKVYFFDKEEDVTEVRELEINKYGEMSEWPKDFLDTDRRENTRRLLDTVADAIFESENDQTGNSDD